VFFGPRTHVRLTLDPLDDGEMQLVTGK
jgi:hypothetical protein